MAAVAAAAFIAPIASGCAYGSLAPGAKSPSPSDAIAVPTQTDAPTLFAASDAPVSPQPSSAMSRDEAIDAARPYLPVSADADAWAALQGRFADVYAALSNHPTYAEGYDLPDVDPNQSVWGIEFKLDIDICDPNGVCNTRSGLRSLFIDSANAELLWQSTYAPNPFGPFPSRDPSLDSASPAE